MALLATLSSMSTLVSSIGPAFQAIGAIASKVWEAIKGFVNKYFIEPLKGFWEWIKGAWEDLKSWASDAWESIKGWIDEWFIQPLEVFFDWLGGVWEDIKSFASDCWDGIGSLFNEYVTQPLEVFFDWLGGVWDTIKDKAGVALDWVKDKIGSALEKPIGAIVDTVTEVKDAITGIFDGFKISDVFTIKWWKKLFGGILDVGKSIIGGLVDIIKAPFNFLISTINSILSKIKFKIKVPKWVPKVGGKSFGVDLGEIKIPMLAKGGIVDKPTLAMIGEDGPEAVVPLSKKNNPNGVGMGGGTFNITVNAGGITDRTDKRALAREIGNMIQQEVARSIGGATHRGRF